MRPTVCENRDTVRRAWRIAKVLTWPFNTLLLRRIVVGQRFLDDLPTDRPIIFIVVGHESYYDGFLFATLFGWNSPLLPPSFAAYTTVFREFGRFATWLGLLPISHPSDTVQTWVRDLYRRLKSGWPLAFFADGGWNERQQEHVAILPIARLAARNGVIVVPVRLHLTNINLKSRWPRWHQRPRATLVVTRPLNTANQTAEQVANWIDNFTTVSAGELARATGVQAGA